MRRDETSCPTSLSQNPVHARVAPRSAARAARRLHAFSVIARSSRVCTRLRSPTSRSSGPVQSNFAPTKRSSSCAIARRLHCSGAPVARAEHQSWATCVWRHLFGWPSYQRTIAGRNSVFPGPHVTSSITGDTAKQRTPCRNSSATGRASLQLQGSSLLVRFEATPDASLERSAAGMTGRESLRDTINT